MRNDAGSLRFTGSLFDYYFVQGAISFEEMEPQRALTVSDKIRMPVMVVGACST